MKGCVWTHQSRTPLHHPHLPLLIMLQQRPTVLGPWFLEERTRILNLGPTPSPKTSPLTREMGIRNLLPHLSHHHVGLGMPKERAQLCIMTLLLTPGLHTLPVRWDMTLLYQATNPLNDPHYPLLSHLVNPTPQKTYQTSNFLLHLNMRPTPNLF